MINLDYPQLTQLFTQHQAVGRSESAAFLIWYLENYYRLDSLEAVDAVCDQSGDKGIDGIYVNSSDESIDIFQCKISQKADRTVGDTSLKEFYGTLSQLKDRPTVEHLITAAGTSDVAKLLKRLDIPAKIGAYKVRGIFISNVDADENGQNYLHTCQEIAFVGKNQLLDTYISDSRSGPIASEAIFDISGFEVAAYTVDEKTKAIIAPVRVTELVKLQGIQDQSLFGYNVRGHLGRTQVNRDIAKSIRDKAVHRYFPLFHNGVTIICGHMNQNAERISISEYNVVNGCQSLNEFFENQNELTGDLRVLTKFIQIGVDSALAKQVTKFSNNQNGVKPRDFMSNHKIQIRLQNEFLLNYNNIFYYEAKRGETTGTGESISNENAGLYLMSFDLKEPWATHRKYQVFEDKYNSLFSRPEVTADRIVLCHVAAKCIDELVHKIKNQLFGKYALTRQVLIYVLRMIMETDDKGKMILRSPEKFVRAENDRVKFTEAVTLCVSDIITDLNAELQDLNEDFDYRGKLRDSEWVKQLQKTLVTSYEKLVRRGTIKSFADGLALHD